MSKINLENYKRSSIEIEAQSLNIEKFINLLWKNNIGVKNIRKKDLTTVSLEVSLKDYLKVDKISKKTHTKLKVIKRKGIAFLFIRIRKRNALIFGTVLFMCILYYLSTFIWKIDIVTEKKLSPYELRRELTSYGVKEGIRKKNLNIGDIEEKLTKNNDEILWVRVRVEGSVLKVVAAERATPPMIVQETTPGNLVAIKDGEVVRVYTTSGTALVKKGDVVKKGQLLVKGEQGREGNIYEVPAKGHVIARTFYEDVKKIPLFEKVKERTGNRVKNIYVSIGNKKIFLKKEMNNFSNYDKIISKKGFLITEECFEIQEKNKAINKKKVIDNYSKEMINKIKESLDKNTEVVDEIVEDKAESDYIILRVLVVGEENIASQEKK
ncbi:sporulation protein YqfD [Clostridium peptidivorans]|uniref:sporulation protein YqfD n=1 Tax=Clostridium peptidivorans TaxID=100174 RepID=UPI001FA8B219|nr:sporulation protein YqfD [Clostridium peptidivorans]